jgi:NitT/TauT family transport system substrate-binding protein
MLKRVILLLAVLQLVACQTAAPTSTPVPTLADQPSLPATRSGETRRITLPLPFRPDIQFAPFYLAQDQGHYAAEGLEVEFEYGNEADFLSLVAAGDLPITIASGEQVILARDEGLPVVYVMTWYQRFPIAVFAPDRTLEGPQDLVGLRVGLPSLTGASYLGWRALLASAGLEADSIATEVTGFNQIEALTAGRVDAALGYIVNEPLRMRREGREVGVIEIADHFDFVANGLVTSEDTLRDEPGLVGSIIRATLRGLRNTLDDPDAAFESALQFVPEMADDPDTARAVLDESLRLWRAEPLGDIDPVAWQRTHDFLLQAGFIEQAAPIEQAIDDRFVRP